MPALSDWRRDSLRTTLWLVPAVELLGAGVLFAITYAVDRAAYTGHLDLPGWVNHGSADAGRQILVGIAAAIITVVGLVFSITIVALTLASTQFGPRMLRNFIRDRGTQITLGTFVATFLYAILVLGSVSSGVRNDFVPHLSITVSLGLTLVDLGVLIFFIHHVAKSIQLPEVIAGIARELSNAISAEFVTIAAASVTSGPDEATVREELGREGGAVAATSSGYLQFVRYETIVEIAARNDAVIELLYRPGHFVVSGLPFARVCPAAAGSEVARELERAHVTGSQRTLTQDLAFAIDQLVEIAIRALSPAVNDTFTALACIDWLSDGLSKISAGPPPSRMHRDAAGRVRVVAPELGYARLVDRGFDKIRQASKGMPAVMIRQLEAVARIMVHATTDEQHAVLRSQADMIMRLADDSVSERGDLADVRGRYEKAIATGVMSR